MYIGAYHFDGDPAGLLPAYDRMREGYPPEALIFHACVARADGITIYDACPSREVFEAFSSSPDLAAALARAGLPTPRVEGLGELHATVPAWIA